MIFKKVITSKSISAKSISARPRRSWRQFPPGCHGGRVQQCFLLPILVLLLVCPACLDSSEDEPAAADGLAPHPDSWVAQGTHGDAYLANQASCATSCHGPELAGGFTGLACSACHQDFPHPAVWISPTEHGEASLGDAGLARCASCHGQDYLGGISEISCYQCHQVYPHESGWISPGVHGKLVLNSNGPERCATSCHGTDYSGGLSDRSCFDCHRTYPHGEGWFSASGHGANVREFGSARCATFCHGFDMQGGDSGLSCFMCHPAYPHLWSTPAEHQAQVSQSGDTTCSSASACHAASRGPDFGGALTCTSFCHVSVEGAAP